MRLTASKSHIIYPADFLKRASEKYYPDIDWELYCEPFVAPGKPYWAFDNFRLNGAERGGNPIFYTQPSYGLEFAKNGQKNNVKCVTYACDPEVHKPVDVEKEYEVGFIGCGGDPTGERDAMLDLIRTKYKSLVTDQVASENLGLEYSKCKVIFNHIRYEEINIRFFEGLALGAMVCSYSPNLHLYAEEGKHYLSFRTQEECWEKIDFLLKNDTIRTDMAKAARQHALKFHTYKNRVEEMLIFLNLI